MINWEYFKELEKDPEYREWLNNWRFLLNLVLNNENIKDEDKIKVVAAFMIKLMSKVLEKCLFR